MKEVYQALESTPGNKSLGNDGLSKESFRSEKLLSHWLRKKGKDKRLIKNWRPISLLNTDTKILSKVLATRIKSVIKSVIQPDQTAYPPGRYIGESVTLISDILEYTDDHSLPGFLVTADIEEAFDSIEYPFIVATLKKLGFGPTFINWLKALLFKQESCVMNKRS